MSELTDTIPLLNAALKAEIVNEITKHVSDIVQQLSDNANVAIQDNQNVSKEASKSLETLKSPKLPEIRQSEPLNLFNRTRFEDYTTCEFTGNFITQNVTETGTLTVTTSPPALFLQLRTKLSVHRLFRVSVLQFTEQGACSSIIKLPLVNYMRLCDLTDKKEARKQVKDDFDFLYRTKLSYEAKEKHNNSKKARLLSLEETPLFKHPPTIKNGIITAELTESFYKYLSSSSCFPMPIFEYVFKFDIRRQRHAFYVANKVLEHFNMNYDRPNKNIISVRALVEACPLLSKNKRRFSQSIKKPLENTMEYLPYHGITFEYCNKSGKPLTDRQIKKINNKMTYDDFLNLRVKFTIEEYPTRDPKKPRSKTKEKQSKYKKLGG